jgi:AraC-like DNA-binding protein
MNNASTQMDEATVSSEIDPVLEELGQILLDCLRLSHVSSRATSHILDAIRLRALEAGWFNQRPMRSEQVLQPWQEELAIQLLMSPASAPVTISMVAASCGISSAQFSRAFKARFGAPPLQWRLTARVERAKAMMLETKRTLTDIALECGFTEQSHFNHIFLKRVGAAPNAWRRHAVATQHAGMLDAQHP